MSTPTSTEVEPEPEIDSITNGTSGPDSEVLAYVRTMTHTLKCRLVAQ